MKISSRVCDLSPVQLQPLYLEQDVRGIFLTFVSFLTLSFDTIILSHASDAKCNKTSSVDDLQMELEVMLLL